MTGDATIHSSTPAGSLLSGASGKPTSPPGRAFARVLQDRARDADAPQSFAAAGLFQPAVPWTADRIGAAPHGALAEVVASAPAAAQPRDAQVERPTMAAPQLQPRAPVAIEAIAERSRSAIQAGEVHVGGPGVPSEPARPLDPSAGSATRSTSSAASAAARRPARAEAALPLRVAVDALATGVLVRVTAGDLDAAEHRDLADRVAALLARHGYAGAGVTVNGIPPLPHGRGQDPWR